MSAGRNARSLRAQTPPPRSRADHVRRFSSGTWPELFGGGGLDDLGDDGERIEAWRGEASPNTEVVMSWVADEEHGGGNITPKTALRFKTSALARAMHN